MVHKSVLIRTDDKVRAYIGKYVTRVGPEKREEVLELFDNMHQFFPGWVIMTCPVMHPDICYISKNTPFVFGYSSEQLISNMSSEKYFPLVHPADQQDLYACYSYMQDFMETILPEQHHLYRSIFYYRFKKPNGQYIHLHDEKASLNLRGGNLYYALMQDLTAARVFSGVKLELYRQDDILNKIKDYKPSAERIALSKREDQLVMLIKQGLSTKEIAWHLNISHHTVRNIKSKLFEKYNVNNSIELLNLTA